MSRQATPDEKGLSQVVERLDALIILLLPRVPEGKRTDETRVLEYCDFGHTREQIATEIGKATSVVDPILSRLRKAGRIRSMARNGQTVYLRTGT
jgi:hypothetical protein